MKLFHLSDDAAIVRFEPQPSAHTSKPVVWAIAEGRLANYLLPRDCPRVCFRAGEASSVDDRIRFLGDERAIIAVEEAWLPRVAAASLVSYAMPNAGFRLQDEGAGYWVSEVGVTPTASETLTQLPRAIAARGVALRVLPSLWALHDAVAGSSLVFSMIRMRNAAPR